MASKINMIINLLSIFFSFCTCLSYSHGWIQAGYWYPGNEPTTPEISPGLFTHLLFAFADVNPSTFRLIIPSDNEQHFSSFTRIIKRKNPSITTLLSIWNGHDEVYKAIVAGEKANNNNIDNHSVMSSMLKSSTSRKSFIDDSIRTAREYGFQGLDLCWLWPNSGQDMTNLGILLDELREAVDSESRNSNWERLILTMALHYAPDYESVSYPIESLVRNLDWGHVVAYLYHLPTKEKVTGAHSALYDPLSHTNTDYGVRQWLSRGFPSTKLVLGLPFYGYAWSLVDTRDSKVGAKASGLVMSLDGSMSYKYIKRYTSFHRAKIVYDSTYVVNYCVVGSTWIGFDDVEAIRAKIVYAKTMKLLGYSVFHVRDDDNWSLSRAAQGEEGDQERNKKRLLTIVLVTTTMSFLLLATCLFVRRIMRGSKRWIGTPLRSLLCRQKIGSATEDVEGNSYNMQMFSYSVVEVATDNFSSKNKLGEGGFGPVYKGTLANGQDFAVKRLSKTSNQGIEEFRNEVSLTANLQHVNLVRVLGYCTEKEEKMIVYECMQNKSLDFYLFDPARKHLLDWNKRVRIIEGITQGLLYLQEYSNLTIVHRDLKASNILLDHEMNPKISDFGVARAFGKDEHEANTDRIVGTYGYLPPEYVETGTYSMKYDVYSFGVLLLQLISGKRNNVREYGMNEDLNLVEYAYELWKEGQGLKFIDSMLVDSSSMHEILRCLDVALLCVQENPIDRPSMMRVYSMHKSES